MKLAIDAMGGDHAPEEIVKGTMTALQQYKDLEVTLIGDEEKIRPYITSDERVSILHTTEVIEGTDEPVRAVRRKKNASMVLMAKEDRKSTRLNSSHVKISYAVFCLKKKKKQTNLEELSDEYKYTE